jgi:hypothetical protein
MTTPQLKRANMTVQNIKKLSVKNYDDFRDLLSSSGIFEMTDCAIEIWCPERSEALEVEKMVKLLESMVHVTDVRVGSRIEDMTADDYLVVVREEKFTSPRRKTREK